MDAQLSFEVLGRHHRLHNSGLGYSFDFLKRIFVKYFLVYPFFLYISFFLSLLLYFKVKIIDITIDYY